MACMINVCPQPDGFFKYLLLFMSIAFFVIFVLNTSISIEPIYQLQRDNTAVQKHDQSDQTHQSWNSSKFTICPDMAVKSHENVLKYKSQCNIHHLTKLSMSTSDGTSHLRNTLSAMVKTSQGSYCNCPRHLKVAHFPLPRTALLSFPGSGNTWTRHLIQQLTGIHSGSVYKFASIKKEGFPFEGVTDNMIVVKTHKSPKNDGSLHLEYMDKSELSVHFHQQIVLLRNPYAAFVAEFKRGSLRLGKVKNKFIDNTSPKWKNFVSVRSKIWRGFIKNAFSTKLPFLVVYYEDLASCLLPELFKVAAFLGNKNLKEFSFCCTLKDQEGSFHRPPSNQTVKDVFSEVDRNIMNNVLLEVAAYVNDAYPKVAKRILEYVL